MIGKLTNLADIYYYIFAGKAIFTLVSPKTGRRYTYKVTEDILADGQKTYKIHLLQGDDNTKDYHFIARLYYNKAQIWWQKHKCFTTDIDEVSVTEGYSYAESAINCILQYPEFYIMKGGEFWHSGRCAKCGRLLTTPKSVATGIGPHCRRKQ